MMNLLNAYEATTAATAYILGFLLNGNVYAITVKSLPTWLIGLDRESKTHGGFNKLRIRMNNIARARLMNLGASYIGTAEEVLTMKNKGDAFEKWIAESLGQKWQKTSTPYFLAADVNANGERYQVKFESASLANEKTIAMAMRAAHL